MNRGAARAEAVAGEGYQALKRAAPTTHPGKAVGQHPAGQELAKLPCDELGQTGAVSPIGRGEKKIVQVLADDDVEHARLGMPGPVHRMIAGHGPR